MSAKSHTCKKCGNPLSETEIKFSSVSPQGNICDKCIILARREERVSVQYKKNLETVPPAYGKRSKKKEVLDKDIGRDVINLTSVICTGIYVDKIQKTAWDIIIANWKQGIDAKAVEAYLLIDNSGGNKWDKKQENPVDQYIEHKGMLVVFGTDDVSDPAKQISRLIVDRHTMSLPTMVVCTSMEALKPMLTARAYGIISTWHRYPPK